MEFLKIGLSFVCLFLSSLAWAQAPAASSSEMPASGTHLSAAHPGKALTSEEALQIRQWNQQLQTLESGAVMETPEQDERPSRPEEDPWRGWDFDDQMEPQSPAFPVARPFNDFDEVKTLIFAGHNFWSEARQAKAKIVENLPQGVEVLIYDSNGSREAGLRDLPFFQALNSMIQVVRELFRVSGIGFWSRDVIPVPVYLQDGRLAAVDARYYRSFEPDAEVGRYFDIPIVKHEYIFEGGNFLSDADGNCFMVNNNRGSSRIPDRIFHEFYGCEHLVRFPMRGGIGHMDERLKIFPDKVAMTDTPDYRPTLEALGYRVVEVPRGSQHFETYINSILINGVVFLPIFNHPNDSEVVNSYTQLGYQVVPIYTNDLPNDGNGSLHCITMTYPEKL